MNLANISPSNNNKAPLNIAAKQSLLSQKNLVHGEKKEDSYYNPELVQLQKEYKKWCERMDKLGRWVALYDCPTKQSKLSYKMYSWFIFICCMWGTVGWIIALFYSAAYQEAIPCIISFYEIHSDNEPKNFWESIGVILLTLVAMINFIFRPKLFKADYQTADVNGNSLEDIGYCPTGNIKSLKEMIKIIRRSVIGAYAIPIISLIGGCTIWNINLGNIIKKDGKFSCEDNFFVVLDQLLVYPIYAVASAVVGHTSMSFALKMAYYKQCLRLMKEDLRNKNTEQEDVDSMALVDHFNAIQHNINITGKEFGMYLGIYTTCCVLCSSFFVGKLSSDAKKINILDFTIRVFFQCLFIIPNIYILVQAASLGTQGMQVMRNFLRRPIHTHNADSLIKRNYAINYFNLRLNVGDVGLRMYGILLNFKTLTQLFSLWFTFLTMIYGRAGGDG